ncbi:MAG: Cell division protein FtsB [Gammaproteobacteria bacterium]|nr:Cell division protein FtsB [Gammaproteobacteria bacterium]
MPGPFAKLSLAVLIALFAGLQFGLWLGDFGLIRYWQLKDQVKAQIKVNERLTTRNRQLQAEVFDLKHGTDALEERARARLGMIKKGEEFYQVIEDGNPRPEDAE